MSVQREDEARSRKSVMGYIGMVILLMSLAYLLATHNASDPTFVSTFILAFSSCAGLVWSAKTGKRN
jgi:hypothetical protein